MTRHHASSLYQITSHHFLHSLFSTRARAVCTVWPLHGWDGPSHTPCPFSPYQCTHGGQGWDADAPLPLRPYPSTSMGRRWFSSGMSGS